MDMEQTQFQSLCAAVALNMNAAAEDALALIQRWLHVETALDSDLFMKQWE
jgi:hypothetical protein